MSPCAGCGGRATRSGLPACDKHHLVVYPTLLTAERRALVASGEVVACGDHWHVVEAGRA